MFDNLYYYKARVVRVYDGDTIHVDIDLGLSTWIKKEKLRLARINAPEIRGSQRPAGLAARDFLRNLILDKEVIGEIRSVPGGNLVANRKWLGKC